MEIPASTTDMGCWTLTCSIASSRSIRRPANWKRQAGVSLADILALLISRPAHEPRWFLPVTPGTKFVTVGGAIANDVHGKSHHSTGCFGAHVRSLRLLRSDGITLDCSLEQNVDLFRATLGGLGLTGLILSARVALTRVAGFWLETEDFRYDDLDAFFRLSEESHAEWQYTVAWVDCLARGRSLGRGVFSRARHCARLPPGAGAPFAAKPRFAMRFDAPGFLLNRHSVGAFNAFRWRRFARQPKRELRAFDQVLYPLDAIADWNRLYGRRGFFQYQCVIPDASARKGVQSLLERVAESGKALSRGAEDVRRRAVARTAFVPAPRRDTRAGFAESRRRHTGADEESGHLGRRRRRTPLPGEG